MLWLNDSRRLRLELRFWLRTYNVYLVLWLLITFFSPYGPLVNLAASAGTFVLFKVSLPANAKRYRYGLQLIALEDDLTRYIEQKMGPTIEKIVKEAFRALS